MTTWTEKTDPSTGFTEQHDTWVIEGDDFGVFTDATGYTFSGDADGVITELSDLTMVGETDGVLVVIDDTPSDTSFTEKTDPSTTWTEA